MIANLLPNEAIHSSLDLFEKQLLLITFENAFDQKIGPVYSPNGPMLEFEITGDRNNFVDLQKIYLEIRCKVTQSNGADLRYDNTDPTVSDSPFLVNNSLYSLFSDCTLSANGLKISNANSNFAHKSFIGTEFSNSKGAKDSWLKCQGYRFENNPAAIDVSLPSAEVVFFTQVCFIFILLSLSISKLSFYNLSCDETAIWLSILSSTVGYMLPNPKL